MSVAEMVFLFVFPFAFIGTWYFALRNLSLMSGWVQLAECFYYPEKFHGAYYRFQSARMKKINFSSSLEIGVNDQGLYLVPVIFFRLFHKPILIPWREIEVELFKKYFFVGYRLRIQSVPDVSFEIYARTFEKMKGYLKM